MSGSRFNGQIFTKDLIEEPGTTGTRSDYREHTDPEYIGPGTWNLLHRISFKARSHEQQVNFIKFMREVCDSFPCPTCGRHCIEYINNHPMEDYLDVLVDIDNERLLLGLFVWTWKFHNAVNARLKKPIMSWNTAYSIYSQEEPSVCSRKCGGSKESHYPPEYQTSALSTNRVRSEAFRLIRINRGR